MKKFERLFLHIGLEKTGTTSIQGFLHDNRDVLKERGLFVPGSLGNVNHKMLAAYALNYGSHDIAITSMNIGKESRDLDRFRERVATSFQAEVEGSSARTAIISSEDLSRLFLPEEIARVVSLLRKVAEQLTVIAFVRRQDLLAVSRYYSLVIGGSKVVSVFPSPSQASRYYEYYQNLMRWAAAVGRKNMMLVRFPEFPKAVKFDSVERLCALIGTDPAGLVSESERNISLDAVNQIIIQNYNVLRNGFEPGEIERLKERLAPFNDRQYTYLTSSRQAEEFYSRYRAGNARLFKELGREADGFSEDFSMYPAHNLRHELQQVAIRRLLGMLVQ